IRVPCSRIMGVLPSLLTIRFVSHTARPIKEARAVPATYRNESREGVRETYGVATPRRRAWGTDALRAPPTQQRRGAARATLPPTIVVAGVHGDASKVRGATPLRGRCT